MRKIQSAQSGFTLIELVVVIVILGILAATALPKFVDLTSDASNAAANGVAAAIASGTATNYGAKMANNASAVDVKGNPCTAATLGNFVTGVSLMDGGGSTGPSSSTQFAVSGTGACSGAGTTTACTIQGQKGTAQTATVICTGT